MRLHRLALLALLAAPVVADAQRQAIADVNIPAVIDPATPQSVRRLLSVIAADSMEGRAIWKPGSDRAAKYIAEQMRRIGLVPAGDSGYFQKIPGALQANGRVLRLPKLSDLDTVPVERRRLAVNVIGILPGKVSFTDTIRAFRNSSTIPGTVVTVRDPSRDSIFTRTLSDSIVLVDAHYDHVGIGRPQNGDSIYNGADDDASGTVAVLEIARIMKKWPTPRRTVIFAATTGEEAGLVGTRWYIENPVRPMSAVSSNLEIEMIGRADTIAVGRGRAWLTGFERSTMGETFQKNGLPIMADMRPSQSFFSRSDNIAFAQMGIPAHTLSSFNLHTDYHQASDEVDKVDFNHMAALINIGARAVWVLTDGPQPAWHNGMRPCPPAPRPAGGFAGRGGRGGPPATLTRAQQDSAMAYNDSVRVANQFPRACVR